VKVELVVIDELDLDPQNARKHDDKNLKAIADSLRQFGQRKPIVLHGKTVVAGNGTLVAARSLGWTHIDAVHVPADWTADQVKAYAIADNRSAELAEWDDKVLSAQLLDLEAAGFDIKSFGFDYEDTSILEIETTEDDAPDSSQVESRAALGQVWKLGNHRVVCGDSTSSQVVSLALDGNLADCILTDPPYNVDYHGGTEDKLTIQNDNMSDDDFDKFLYAFYEAAFNNTRVGAPIYVFHADIKAEYFIHNFVKSGWLYKQCLIWAKDSLVLGRKDYNFQHEPILYGWKPGAAHSWYGPFTNTTLIELKKQDFSKLSGQELLDLVNNIFETSGLVRDAKPRRNALHPTMKPISLVAKLLKNSAKRNDWVLDQFGGSGSTLVACEQLGLKAAVIELDPKYVDVIISRWEKLTGKTAELIKD
jgi:DNA modification methylase